MIVSMIDEQGAGFALGAAEYLVKPVDRDASARRAGALRVAAARAAHAGGDRRRPGRSGPRSRRCSRREGWRVVRATGGEEGVRAGPAGAPGRRGARPADARRRRLRGRRAAARRPARRRRPDRRADVEGDDAAPTTSGSRARSASWRRRGRSRRPSSSSSSAAWPARSSRRRGHMTEPALVLIVEDNPRNLKLARDVLNHAGYETLEAENAEDGLALARARHPGAGPDGRPAAGHGRRRGARPPARRPGDRRHPGDRADRVRDEGRTASASSPPASTTTSRSRSTSASSRGRSPRRSPAPAGGADDDRARRRSSSSTTCRRTSGCSRRSSRRAAIASSSANSGREALERVAARADRPRAARHPDAGDGRLRGLPARCAPTRRRASCRS